MRGKGINILTSKRIPVQNTKKPVFTHIVNLKDRTEYRSAASGRLHREDGPAVVWKKEGNEEWFFKGWRHRKGGPALLYNRDNTLQEKYFEKGVEHRENGPASFTRIKEGKNKETQIIEYFVEGELHREDGPAHIEIVLKNGQEIKRNEEWWVHGVKHREDGPASSNYNLEEDYRHEMWYKDGEAHREDGPSLQVWKNGKKVKEEWQVNDKYHRIGGPAFIEPNKVIYYENGLVHNDHGPALMERDPRPGAWLFTYYQKGIMVPVQNATEIQRAGQYKLEEVIKDGQEFTDFDYFS